MKLLAFGLGVGTAVQAWRNFPADGPAQANSVAVVFILGMIAAYFGGRARRRPSAVAVASAEATATATNETNVQVAVVMPGQGARPAGLVVPDAVSWRGSERLQVTESDLDGMDLSELTTDTLPEAAP